MKATRLKPSKHHWQRAEHEFESYVCDRCSTLWFGTDPPARGCLRLKRTRLKSVSPRRDEKREKREVYGPLCEAARQQERCWICLEWVPLGCHPHHVRRVNAGWADWLPDATGNVCPACAPCHRKCHDVAGFEAEKKVAVRAAEFGKRFVAGDA